MTDAAAPLAIDLFCGLGGWTEGLLAEGYRVVGFDIERHEYGGQRYPGRLVLQDALTIHGSQFRNAALIVASPPCQEYSYMAMPWGRAKQIEAEYLAGVRDVRALTACFDACFRIQAEAIAAAGRHIPMVVENVRGAQKWVGRSRYRFGSFHLWGDVPALMPLAKAPPKVAGLEFAGVGRRSSAAVGGRFTSDEGIKQGGLSGVRANGKGDRWFQDGAAKSGSKSLARKQASAEIAKIPIVLSRHVARSWFPDQAVAS